MDIEIDLDALNKDNAKITSLWNDVLITIRKRDKYSRDKHNDYQ